VIELRYDIVAPETLEAGYGLLSYTDGVLALDTPYAAIPVYNEEGWNVETPPANADTSFNDASFYLTRVTAPAGVTVVATGVAVETQARGDQRETTFALGPARDFYLAASGEYTVESRQVGETRINSYAQPGAEARRDAALDAAAAALASLSGAFGPYPYTEFDVAATPMLALGIEYPGAVGISTRVYDSTDAALARVLESTVVHEAAHQWFYNLVGSDQIDEPWLDEALAQYATWLYFRDERGAAAAQAWRDNWAARWDRVERAEKPVGLPAAEYEPREYGAIVYGRGPLFMSALAERMGQEPFEAFLGDYARAFRWEIATAQDFKSMAEAACGCELDDLWAGWLDAGQ
jgi:aminopeptidase N